MVQSGQGHPLRDFAACNATGTTTKCVEEEDVFHSPAEQQFRRSGHKLRTGCFFWFDPDRNPNRRSWWQAGSRSGLAIRLRHSRIVSAKTWRKKASSGAIARRTCYWSFGAKTAFSDSFKVRRGTTLSFGDSLKTWQKVGSSVLWLKFDLKSRL